MDKLLFPNPQFIRKNWMDLNGQWNFEFDDFDEGIKNKYYLNSDSFFQKEIMVPFTYQTRSSTVHLNENHPIVWYQKKIMLDFDEHKKYILNFGAVDYQCDIWINGNHVKQHIGGHTPFNVDISEFAATETNIVVRAEDFNSTRQAIGKQTWKDTNFLCWYTRTVGIWQQVWLEEVGESYLDSVRMTPNIDNASLEIDALLNGKKEDYTLNVIISYQEEVLVKTSINFKNQRAKFQVDVSSNQPDFRLNYWSPQAPSLYDIKFEVLDTTNHLVDEVYSYFGMRNVRVKNNMIYLNNQEIYQKLILDQGYFKNGGLTGTYKELEDDVKKIKEFGFNGVRKHQKIEDHRFMYLCDVYGLFMWAEMPSPFEYSAETNENFVREIHPFVSKHYNHPSVIVYTLMNESWGINEVYDNIEQQNFVNALYYLVKSLDKTRLVVGNDGWEHTITDIVTIHDYNDEPNSFRKSYRDIEEAANGSPSRTSTRHVFSKEYKYSNQPFMVSEYGGIAYEENDKGKVSWGYGERLVDKKDVIERIGELTKVLMDNENMCGFCYTQLTDVEQEVNGLLDEDHNYKFDPELIKEIMTYKHNLGFTFI